MDGETVEEFVTDLERLSMDCSFGVLKNSLIKDRIISGIQTEKGNESIVKLLLDHGANPAAVDEIGHTLLHLATKSNSLSIVKHLLNSGCILKSMFSSADKGYTPIHIAAENGQEDIVKLFLEKRLSADCQTKNGVSPIHLAAQKGHKGIVLLLSKYGSTSAEVGQRIIQSPLFFAAEIGNFEVVEILSENTARAAEWNEAYPALYEYIASYHGHENVVRILLQKGADSNFSFEKCLPSLHAAAQQGRDKVAEILVEHGAKINCKVETKSGNHSGLAETDEHFSTSLLAAARGGHARMAEFLLQKGADVKSQLRSTVESGKPDVVNLLLKCGADVNSKFKNHSTPLALAIELENESIVEVLLKADTDPSIQNTNYRAVVVAITNKNVEIVDLLLNYKAAINFIFNYNPKCFMYSKHFDGFTPLHIAISEKSVEIVELLLKKGASIEINTEQDLPLHTAIENGDMEIVNKLLEYGVKIDSVCKKTLTPFFHSVKCNKKECLKILLKKGACVESKTVMERLYSTLLLIIKLIQT
ncbi:ankyrin-1-like [Belonocnema kinseyi]|uniref:ankyrin-1-like n=1 Tax=Belonocnema kinseyi TaxID=2817044 RepID=UPI00143E0E7D|nr:ankyrin-1-like [Belonocnema kinseyi]